MRRRFDLLRLSLLLLCTFLAQTSLQARADQPNFGLEGTIVELPGKYGGAKGYRITRVYRHSRAFAAGLEPGDTIVYINHMTFRDRRAYDYAMCQVGDTAWIGVINVRNGQLTWVQARFGHRPHGGTPPSGFGVVDFVHQAVVTIYNRSGAQLSFQLRWRGRDGEWSDWQTFSLGIRRYVYQSYSGAEQIQIRFDCIGGDNAFTEKIYDLDFNAVDIPRDVDQNDGREYYFQFHRDGRTLDLYSCPDS